MSNKSNEIINFERKRIGKNQNWYGIIREEKKEVFLVAEGKLFQNELTNARKYGGFSNIRKKSCNAYQNNLPTLIRVPCMAFKIAEKISKSKLGK